MSCEVWNLEVKTMKWLEGKENLESGRLQYINFAWLFLVIFYRLWRIEKLPASITCYRLSHSASPRTLSSHWNMDASNLNLPVNITKWVKKNCVCSHFNLLSYIVIIAFCIIFNVGVMSNDLTNEIECKCKGRFADCGVYSQNISSHSHTL